MTRNPFRPRRRRAAWLAILSLSAISTMSLHAAAETDLAAYADHLLSQAYPAGEPGAAALVMQDGRTVLRQGYGLADLELGVPIQPEHVFEIGSVTKQFTAAAILMLAERGLLSVDDEVTKHLPGYPTHGHRITLKHLLTHTSGIPSYTGLPEWLPRVREDLTVEQLMAIFKDKPLEFAPGERFSYNNSGYVLLGAVIEKVSGKSYEDFIEQEIFQPLGMTRSSYGHQREVVPGRVEGYDRTEEGYRHAAYLSLTQPYAAGSLLSTVDDLARWTDALWGGKVLQPASMERMLTPMRLTSGTSTRYGFGWGVSDFAGHRFVEHSGGIFGFLSYVLRVPEKNLVVVLLSNNPGAEVRPDTLVTKIALLALGRPLEDWPVLRLDAAALDEYTGVYRFPDTDRYITREGGRLFAQRSGGGKLEILPTARDEFFYPDSGSRLRFRRDGQGRITGLELDQRGRAVEEGARTDEPLPAERQAVAVDPALFNAYAGVYEVAPGFELAVTREGDRLFVQPTRQPKAEIFPASETEFFLKVVDARLVFLRGEGGRAESLVLHQGGREMPARRLR